MIINLTAGVQVQTMWHRLIPSSASLLSKTISLRIAQTTIAVTGSLEESKLFGTPRFKEQHNSGASCNLHTLEEGNPSAVFHDLQTSMRNQSRQAPSSPRLSPSDNRWTQHHQQKGSAWTRTKNKQLWWHVLSSSLRTPLFFKEIPQWAGRIRLKNPNYNKWLVWEASWPTHSKVAPHLSRDTWVGWWKDLSGDR